MSKINLLQLHHWPICVLNGPTWTSWLSRERESTKKYPYVPKSDKKVPNSTLKYKNTKVPKLGLLGCKTLEAIPSTIAPYYYCHY